MPMAVNVNQKQVVIAGVILAVMLFIFFSRPYGSMIRQRLWNRISQLFQKTQQENPFPYSSTPSSPPAAGTQYGSSENPFGVMIPLQSISLDTRVSLARSLGVIYYRGSDVKTDRWTGTCEECDIAVKNGMKLVLTIRNGGGRGQPSTPPTDLNAYKKTVKDIVTKYKPAVLVVENEENSGELFYSGTPEEYHRELKAACEASHALGVKCTNGGLVSSLTALLTANSYYEQGDSGKADEFFKRTLGNRQAELGLSSFTQALANNKVKSQIAKGKALLAGYKKSGADYVNFHWYIADTKAMDESVGFLQKMTGLPAMTNEVGQQKNEDPEQVKRIMQKIVELKLPYAVWFSMDVQGFAGARSLLNPDNSIRPNGTAFQNFIKTTYK